MSTRLPLPTRRHHIKQKVKVAGQRTLYLSVHDDEQPAEIFLRMKGPDYSAGLIGLYDVAQFAPCGPVSGHDRIKQCSSLPDLIGRHLLVEYCDRQELACSTIENAEGVA